jgi:hypothetical protein
MIRIARIPAPVAVITLDFAQVDILLDLVDDQIKDITSGNTSYGSEVDTQDMLDEIKQIRKILYSAHL